ncbi:porphobilinogen deaminase [Candidatus Puniceispirillum marinum IMCC1322]|uniref:Porphobilinogen deaminase n=2 Tax=Candidatus Puniceispirillum TaxID=767891 RepID=D5BTX1_PUNMI|nr:porphobilinogen deaminase [Candidatus Puniceispirillum marinum IMCC1322]
MVSWRKQMTLDFLAFFWAMQAGVGALDMAVMKPDASYFFATPLVLASRASTLAMAQAELVRVALKPVASRIEPFTTKGDLILDRPLVEVGGKGVFIKELERSLLAGESDAAVHSMKDMESDFAAGTMIGAVLPREDRRDALVGSYADLDALPDGAIVGTSSVRRRALLLHHRPDLRIKLLRGNINKRIAKLNQGDYDAIILAVAGLKRLKLSLDYTPLDEKLMPTAAAQGALAVQLCDPSLAQGEKAIRQQAVFDAISPLACVNSTIEVTAERAMLAHLDGSCHTPIAASARFVDDKTLRLDGMVLSSDGSAAFRRTMTASKDEAVALGIKVGVALLDDAGGRGFLA